MVSSMSLAWLTEEVEAEPFDIVAERTFEHLKNRTQMSWLGAESERSVRKMAERGTHFLEASRPRAWSAARPYVTMMEMLVKKEGTARRSSLLVLVVLLAVTIASLAWGERGRLGRVPTYHDRARCGVADPVVLPPLTHLQVDLDGDSTPEHYFANSGGVERHGYRRGSNPPTLVREAVIYSSNTTGRYACADLRPMDVDGDGDSDLIYGSHAELVVLTNEGGRFRVARREPQTLPITANVRIELRNGQPALRQ